MRRSLVVTAVGCIVMLLAVGCSKEPAGTNGQPAQGGGTSGAKAPAPAKPAPTSADTVQQEKDNMVAGINKTLTDMDKWIQSLAAMAEKQGGQAKEDWDQKFKPQLDKDMADVKAALDKAKSATAEDWNNAKQSVGAAMGRLMNHYDKEHKTLAPPEPAPSAPAKPAAESGGTSK